MPTKIARLMALADTEYLKTRHQPTRQRFKGQSVNLSALDESWERKRSTAARFMGVVLRQDSETLLRAVCGDEGKARTYTEGVEWLNREATYLRKVANRLELAAGRISSVLARCSEHTAPDPSATANQ